MFASLSCGDDLFRVVIRIAANRYDIDIGIGQHFGHISVSRDGAPMLSTKLFSIELAGGTDRGDLALGGGIDCRNVRARHPTVTNNANVVFFHSCSTDSSPSF